MIHLIISRVLDLLILGVIICCHNHHHPPEISNFMTSVILIIVADFSLVNIPSLKFGDFVRKRS